ncbi:MAG: amidohydrolase family protein, partial [Chloroflexi bacterium]|nr:amidohydrolase family protein [Chloroflexota bacterium]
MSRSAPALSTQHSGLSTPSSVLRIAGGRVLDPANGVEAEADLLIVDGRIEGLARPARARAGVRVIDARGCTVAPGFVDLHCHLGDPGREDAETLASGTAAAAAGGFTSLCCMADTLPPLDSAAAIEALCSRARAQTRVRVLPLGTVTRGREGRELAELAEMAAAGAVAFSDDGRPIASARLLRHALEYSLLADRPVVDHAEDPELACEGQVHEGELATVLGLRGIPAEAEEVAVARDLALARLTGARLHLA